MKLLISTLLILLCATLESKSQVIKDSITDRFDEWLTKDYFYNDYLKAHVSSVAEFYQEKLDNRNLIKSQQAFFDNKGRITFLRYGQDISKHTAFNIKETLFFYYLTELSDSATIMVKNIDYNFNNQFDRYDYIPKQYVKDSVTYFNITTYKKGLPTYVTRLYEDGKLWLSKEIVRSKDAATFIPSPYPSFYGIGGVKNIDSLHCNKNKKGQIIDATYYFYNNNPNNTHYRYFYNKKNLITKIEQYNKDGVAVVIKYKYKYFK